MPTARRLAVRVATTRTTRRRCQCGARRGVPRQQRAASRRLWPATVASSCGGGRRGSSARRLCCISRSACRRAALHALQLHALLLVPAA